MGRLPYSWVDFSLRRLGNNSQVACLTIPANDVNRLCAESTVIDNGTKLG